MLSCTFLSFEVIVNGEKTYDSNLESPCFKSDISHRISLGEILPLFIEIDEVFFVYENGYKFEFSTDISDGVFDVYLDSNDDGDIFFRNRKISQVYATGEICTIPGDFLEIWISWEGEAELKKIIAGFSEIFGIKTHVLYVPNTYSKLISIIRSGGKLPDAIMVEADYIATLVESRAIQNIDYVADPENETADHFGKLKESFTLKDKNWAFPFYADTHVIIYNKKLIDFPNEILSKKSLTLMEMKDMGNFLKKDGCIPITWNAYSGYFFIPFIMGFGKDNFIEEDGGININDGHSLSALEYILELADSNVLDISERDAMTALFVEENAASIIGGTYMIPYLKSLGMDIGVLHLPYNESSEKYVSPVLDVKGFSISRKARNPILAKRLIQYLCSEKIQEYFCNQLFKIPCRAESLKKIYGEGIYGDVLEMSVSNGIPIPPEKTYSIYKSTLWNTLRFAITGQMTAGESLDAAQKIIDNNLKK